MRALAILVLSAVLLTGGASAQPALRADQAAAFDGRAIEFGAYPIGKHFASLPGDLRPVEACDPANPNNGDGSCLYRGDDGVTYYVLDNSHIVNKWIDVADTPPGHLPYGLTGRETPEQARASMQSRFSLPFKIVRNAADEQLVTVDGYLRGEGGMDFLFYLIFSADGRFEQIRLQGPPTM